MVLNSVTIFIGVCVCSVLAISLLVVLLKETRAALKTKEKEYNALRNQYNALQQEHTNFLLQQKKKEEAHAQTQSQIADVANATPSDIAEQLQHRTKNSVRH